MTDVREMYEMTEMELAQKLLCADKEKVFVVAQIAPAVRVTIGEKFGLARGEDGMKKLSTVLRMMGVDAVVDTAIAQDVMTLTQAKALRAKKEKGGAPVVVGKGAEGACPGEMSARLLRKYYGAREAGKSVRVVAVVCCEKAKGKLKGADVVLTVDELTEMISATGVNFRLLKKSVIDTPFGVASGAAYICASAGGKAEAVARCLMENKSREAAQKLAYSGLYGKGAVKEATVVAGGQEWKFAVVVCPEAAEKVRADIANGVCEYDFVEFSCGGCIAKGLADDEDKEMTVKLRGLGLRYLDKAHAARSADMSAYAALALKEWEGMVRSGEANAENAPITEEELTPVPEEEETVEVIIEAVIEEDEKHTPVIDVIEERVEIPAEEVVEEAVEAISVEETVEEAVEAIPVEETVEEAPVEEVAEVEETVEETPVEEVAEAEETVEETPAEELAEAEEVVEDFVEEAAEDVADIIVEDIVEETVETAVEQIPVEEIAEEVLERFGEDATEEEIREVVEELVEETLEDAVEEYVEDVVEEFVEEHLEEVVEDIVEDLAEEMVDDVVEKVDEDVAEMVEDAVTDALVEDAVDEIIEEAAEDAAEEIIDKIVDELVEKTAEELAEVAEEAPVEETAAEVEAEVACEDASEAEDSNANHYYQRLSGKDRRKLKRQKKNNK